MAAGPAGQLGRADLRRARAATERRLVPGEGNGEVDAPCILPRTGPDSDELRAVLLRERVGRVRDGLV